jgi:hypothetical protein
MTNQFPEDPLTHIKSWQDKFKEHKQQCGVAEMNEPGVTKDSREALHDTANATDTIKDWRTFCAEVLDESKWEPDLSCDKQEAVRDFADTICCALEKMSGKEVFECFFEAVQDKYNHTKKEYDKACELLDLLTGL